MLTSSINLSLCDYNIFIMKHIGSDIEFELDLFSETFSLTLHILFSQNISCIMKL